MTPPKVSLNFEALLSRRGEEMDMHFRRPESQRRQKFLVAVDALAEVPAFATKTGTDSSNSLRSATQSVDFTFNMEEARNPRGRRRSFAPVAHRRGRLRAAPASTRNSSSGIIRSMASTSMRAI
jgi:hypothetical protein